LFEHVPFQRRAGVDLSTVRQQLAASLGQLAQATASGTATERLRVIGRVGEAYCLLGNDEMALPLLEEAVALAKKVQDTWLEVVNLIRLATAYQYAGQHGRAESLFRRAVELAQSINYKDRLDFALQHFGKCLVEMGRLDEAAACFEEALALRQVKGDVGLIASTERALAAMWEFAAGGEAG
jgi:tetratricopeptide (TPR) repeat protein